MNGRLSKIRSAHTNGLWNKVDYYFCEFKYEGSNVKTFECYAGQFKQRLRCCHQFL